MSKYDNEMYEFLTKKENYKYANELKDRLIDVNERIKEEFWKDIFDNLESRLSENGFDVEKDGDLDSCGFLINKPEYKYMKMIFDNEGDLVLNIGKERYKESDINKILDKKDGVLKERFNRAQRGEGNWGYIELDYKNFIKKADSERLDSILPEARIDEVSKAVKSMERCVSKMDKLCKEINKLSLK